MAGRWVGWQCSGSSREIGGGLWVAECAIVEHNTEHHRPGNGEE